MKNLSMRNPLLRRVHRHMNMATLFRSSDHTSNSQVVAHPWVVGEMPHMVTEIDNPEQIDVPSPWSARSMTTSNRSEQRENYPIARSVTPMSDTNSAHVAALPSHTIRPQAALENQRQSKAAPNTSASTPTDEPQNESDASQTDRTWSRLQSIVQAHRYRSGEAHAVAVDDQALGVTPENENQPSLDNANFMNEQTDFLQHGQGELPQISPLSDSDSRSGARQILQQSTNPPTKQVRPSAISKQPAESIQNASSAALSSPVNQDGEHSQTLPPPAVAQRKNVQAETVRSKDDSVPVQQEYAEIEGAKGVASADISLPEHDDDKHTRGVPQAAVQLTEPQRESVQAKPTAVPSDTTSVKFGQTKSGLNEQRHPNLQQKGTDQDRVDPAISSPPEHSQQSTDAIAPSEPIHQTPETNSSHAGKDPERSLHDDTLLNVGKSHEQQLPLEAVWPVQRMDDVEPDSPLKRDISPHRAEGVTRSTSGGIGTDNKSSTSEWDTARLAHDQQINEAAHSIMRSVQAARDTESAVHVVVPRRARPVARQPQSINDPKSRYIADEPCTEIDFPTDNQPSSPSITAELLAAEETRGVDDLPNDLWTLIDEPIPIQRAISAKSQQDRKSDSTSQMTLDASNSGAESSYLGEKKSPMSVSSLSSDVEDGDGANDTAVDTSAKKLITHSAMQTGVSAPTVSSSLPNTSGMLSIDHDHLFQRQAAQDIDVIQGDDGIVEPPIFQDNPPSDAKDVAPSHQGDPDASEGEKTTQIDLSDLAQQVYSQLRRQLMIERERIS